MLPTSSSRCATPPTREVCCWRVSGAPGTRLPTSWRRASLPTKPTMAFLARLEETAAWTWRDRSRIAVWREGEDEQLVAQIKIAIGMDMAR